MDGGDWGGGGVNGRIVCMRLPHFYRDHDNSNTILAVELTCAKIAAATPVTKKREASHKPNCLA